jgi:hypothetical protein
MVDWSHTGADSDGGVLATYTAITNPAAAEIKEQQIARFMLPQYYAPSSPTNSSDAGARRKFSVTYNEANSILLWRPILGRCR